MKNRIFPYVLIAYVSLLLAAAWPVTATHIITQNIQRTAERILFRASIVPGLRLFYRPYREHFKIRGQCMEVKGYSADKKVFNLFKTQEGCAPAEGFHFFADAYELMFHRFAEEAILERLASLPRLGQDAFAAKNPPTPRERAVYEVIGDFFCHSSLVSRPSDELVTVAMAWRQDKINYQTGEKFQPYLLLTKWNCNQHQVESIQWRPNVNKEQLESFLHDQAW